MAQGRVTSIALDTDRVLYYRVTDVMAAEQRLGKSVDLTIAERGFIGLTTMIWAGLRHKDEALTIDAVARMMDKSPLRYTELWNRVAEALIASGLVTGPREGADTERPTVPPVPPSGDSGA